MGSVDKFKFCIDRGGTFTDIYAEVPGRPEGYVMKLLSVDPSNYDDAPIEGIRRILEEFSGEKIPRSSKIPTGSIEWIRMGTTVATNALLERKGERIALCVTWGFRDLLQIGNQARPNIFDLKVLKPSNLYEEVIEVDERVELVGDGERDGSSVEGISGELVRVAKPVDEEALKPLLRGLLDKGITCLAVVLMHSYTYPHHEHLIEKLALEMGFKHVSLSSSLTPMVRAVPRGLTASVDAYLTPVIKDYLSGFMSRFEGGAEQVNVLFMQSDGGLAPERRFSGHKAVLSGPAGGVVGYSQTLFELETSKPLIGFDMGGTSTDVSRYDGSYEQVLETQIAGAIIQAPQLDINTVAAGGGSKLKFQFGAFKAGPESVGAHPGPVCYRKGGELAITDANLILGTIIPEYFPSIFGPNEDLPLDYDATRKAFENLAVEINSYRKSQDPSVKDLTIEEIALGFTNVANEAMCRPIRQLTEMKGHDTKNHALACFGGAGPQHACAMARSLGMSELLIHRYCGILSAYGMGLADVIEDLQEPYSAVYSADSAAEASRRVALLVNQVKEKLREQGFGEESIRTDSYLNLRYEGTDTAIMVKQPEKESGSDYADEFLRLFQQEYGFILLNRKILISDVRVQGIGATNILQPRELTPISTKPVPKSSCQIYFSYGWQETPLYKLENLGYGHVLEGPAVIMNGNSTVIVEKDCKAIITKYGNIKIEISAAPSTVKVSEKVADVVQLSIFNHRFMGIAEQMGRTLQRTSISTNIKERLDFSCALFGPDGGLVANAPHVPVHLGAMSSTVRWQLNYWGDNLHEGDVLVTNHPCSGGSHLPDITVITPVFNDGKLIFFVASRGHHAEIGGITPGSMPPFSKCIWEEGAAIKAFKLVERGVFQEEGIVHLLQSPCSDELTNHKIPGTRNIQDNLSDLHAQVAANQRGIVLIKELINQYGLVTVQSYMNHVQKNAEEAVREMLRVVASRVEKENGSCVIEDEDYMDDGSVLHLKLTLDSCKGEATFDFEGTSPEVYGNWNAPEAVTAAAVIYCLRCLVDVDIPLNQGCLAPVKILVPKGSFLSPSDKAAVVGGNVLTSQRVTDVVLMAFQACACSQGCMNNLTFGDDTFGYYETIGGGCGAGPSWDGTSGVQCHMTNTRMTDPEIFEQRYPVLLNRFSIRENSGGSGFHRGGDGLVREIEFRRPVVVSILSERRVHSPRGLKGGGNGARGANVLVRSDGRRVYTRTELLSMVKKHSHLIGWTVVDAEDDASDVGMDDKFWHEMLDLFFVRGRVSKRREEDDLVFFVNNMKLHGSGFSDNMEDPPPFFVRRWAPTQLEKVINVNSATVDWERSFYLNLIAHTSYTVTVAICSIEDLHNRAKKSKPLSPVYKVTKTVYASPSRVNFHLDRRKAVETVPAYPNICFSVDDFDDPFDAVVLSDPEHCYCVILNAHDGAAFPEETESNNTSSNIQSGVNSGSNQEKSPKRTLFSGFVSYQNVREAYDAGRSKFGSFLSLGHDHTKLDRLYMKGPEGRGEVEVAVSGIADQSRERSKKDPGDSFRVLVHRVASAASKLAKHTYEAASANKGLDGELLPLKCCLMSVSLPWDYIAHDLLHKETPPLDL